MQQKFTVKNMAIISAFVLGVFLIIYYWSSIAAGIGVILSAFGPLLIGGVLAYLVNILMRFYERHYFVKHCKKFGNVTRRPVCLVGAIITILGVFGLVIGLVIPQFVECVTMIVNKIPVVAQDLLKNERLQKLIPAAWQEWITDYQTKLQTLDWEEILSKVVDFLKSGFSQHLSTITGVVSSTVSAVWSGILGIIFAVFYLARRDHLLALGSRLMDAIPKPKVREKLEHYGRLFNATFHKYIVAEILSALVQGVLCYIGMTILQLPNAGMIAALVGVMAPIPAIGATVATVFGTVIMLAYSPVKALIFFVMLMAIYLFHGNVTYPKLVGKKVGTPSLVVLIALTLGGAIFGLFGMMLGIPLMSALYQELKAWLDARDAKKAAAVPAESSPSEAAPAPEDEAPFEE